MKTLLLGLGNSVLSDDAIGVRLARDFRAAGGCWPDLDIVEECSIGGLGLIDVLQGCDRAILLDSIESAGGGPGAWHRFTAAALRDTVHLANLHDANLATALELGRRIGMALPADSQIHIFAVEIQDNRTFSERMTPALERAYPALRAIIFQELRALLRNALTAEVARLTSPPRLFMSGAMTIPRAPASAFSRLPLPR